MKTKKIPGTGISEKSGTEYLKNPERNENFLIKKYKNII
jgi:hypothetical protein